MRAISLGLCSVPEQAGHKLCDMGHCHAGLVSDSHGHNMVTLMRKLESCVMWLYGNETNK